MKRFAGWEEGSELASSLEISLVYFMTSAFTLTCVAHMHQFLIAGLAIALDRIRMAKLAEGPAEILEVDTAVTAFPNFKTAPSEPMPIPPRLVHNPSPAPARPTRYRFNRPITTSRHD